MEYGIWNMEYGIRGYGFEGGNSIVVLFSLWVNSILIKFARGPEFDSQLPLFLHEGVFVFV